MHIILRSAGLLVAISFSASLAAADKLGSLTRDTELRKSPSKTAEVITTLAAKNKVRILNRQGGWYQVNNGTQSGWVRLLTVKLYRNNTLALPDKNNTEKQTGTELFDDLATGREQSDQVTAATAVRGIDEEQLSNAEPDQEALELLDQFAADAESAQAAANEVGLRNKKLDYFGDSDKPAPKPKPAQQEEEEEWP